MPKDAFDGTAEPDEVARFAALAEKWWDPKGPLKPLHALNPTRIAFVRDRVAARFGRDALGDQPLRGLEVLDIGCGGGLLSEPMARLGARVVGIDVVEESIRVAQRHARDGGLDIDYRHAAPGALAAAGERYDVVLIMEVVELAMRQKGCPKINLQIRGSNTEMASFYQAIGYEIEDAIGLGKRLETDN